MALAYIAPAEQLLRSIVGMLLCILLVSWLLKRFQQPYFVAYIVAGILLGPHGFGLFTDIETISQIGALGLIMQMFFIGAEIEVPSLLKNLRTLLVGTGVQLLLSVALMVLVGARLDWPVERVILFSFIISVSSSAIILEYLHKNNEVRTRLGIITTGILLMQDFLIVPMIIVLNFLAEASPEVGAVLPGLLVMTLVLVFSRTPFFKRTLWQLPAAKRLDADHELQVFIGLLLCFGLAWLTSELHLSAALGAMLAGIFIARAESTRWLEKTLAPFRVFFLALFFISIGLQIDVGFFRDHFGLIMTLVLCILVINSGINTLVFRLLRESWKNSVYAGALLSQIGEFSLVICTVARGLGLLENFSFQLTLAVISLSMLLTSVWISSIRAFLFRSSPPRNTKSVRRGETPSVSTYVRP